MASILVIGVGTTGLEAMEQAQQFYYEFTKQHTPGQNAAFLFLETDRARKPKKAPNGKTAIEGCYICPNNMQATLSNWHSVNAERYNWLPDAANVLAAGTGAGGQPVFGRVALWAEESTVRNAVINSYNKINGNSNTNIYIVGSLTGGTGTGIFIDLAYLVRSCTNNNNNIYGMFMLPDSQNVGNTTMLPVYENAYSSLRSLDYTYSLTKKGNGYQCKLPSGTDISNLSYPFYNVQFYTTDFSGNGVASLTNLNQLVRTVGFNLTLRMMNVTNQSAPFQQVINARLVDYTMHVPLGQFTTIGMNVFQYPESLLEEYLTDSLLEENMLQRWNDVQYYVDQYGDKHSIDTITSKLKYEATCFVQESLTDIVAKCKGMQMLGKSTFKVALQNEIDTIISGNYKAPSKENYIFSLFNSNSNQPNFCTAITGQAISMRDAFIEIIYKKIESESTSYQNLKIINLWLQYTAAAIENVCKDWKQRFKLDGTPVQWNKCWNSWLSERLSYGWIYIILGCRREWYEEALEGTATLCYYNTFIPMLENIANAILGKNNQQTITLPSGLTLPSIQQLKDSRQKISNLLDSQKDTSLVARKDELRGQMSLQSHSQIHLLFVGKDYKADYQAAMGKYQNEGKFLSYLDISKDSLWRFLLDNSEEKIKATLVSTGLAFIQGLNLFGATNIVQIMKNLPQNDPNYNKVQTLLNGVRDVIRQDTPAMVKLKQNKQFLPHKCLTLIVASTVDENNAQGIVAAMQGYKPSSTSSNFVQIPSLKNTVVVYQEYGYMGSINGKDLTFNPLLHLSYQDQVHGSLQKKVANNLFDKKLRLPYIDTKTLIDTDNIYIQ